jgi:hypothetical protein
MRYLVLVKATPDTEAAVLPGNQLLTDMAKYNEELVNAGVLLAGEGLKASSAGARVHFTPDGKATVIDGPFREGKELIAGFWILQVNSKDEVIEWVTRIPNPDRQEYEVEIREVFEADDVSEAASSAPPSHD